MDADFSIELGREDPVLDFPWNDPAGKLAYVDLKRRPELIASIEEAEKFPELGEFLRVMNSPRSMVETAKCDAWPTTELSAEEDIYNASHKFASYVDVVFSEIDVRLSFSLHEQFARKLVELLRRVPETPRRRRCACGGVTSGRGRRPRRFLLHFVCERLRKRRRQRPSELGSGPEADGECDRAVVGAGSG